MGFLDKAKKMAEKAGPLIDKAAPHARTAVDKAGQQIDKRTGGKYHDKIEQVERQVGEYAEKRMAAGGTAPSADEGFPPTPPATEGFPPTPPATDGFPPTPPPATGETFPAADPAEASGPTGTTTPQPDPDAPTDRPAP
jgi:MT0933-like antitoxin protein